MVCQPFIHHFVVFGRIVSAVNELHDDLRAKLKQIVFNQLSEGGSRGFVTFGIAVSGQIYK